LNASHEEIGNRLKILRKHLKLSQEEFGDRLTVNSKSTVSAYERGALPIAQKALVVLYNDMHVNKDWLERGEGDMFIKETDGDRIRREKAIGQREQKKVPVLGDAAAGTQIELNTDVTYQDQYIDVGDLLRDSEAAFTVYGNSMTPNYPSGSVLGLKRCYDNFIQPGEIYVIETASNRVFKRLYWNDDHTAYVCISDNTMIHETGPRKGKYFYEPFEIPLKDILRMYDVTGMIKRTRNSGIIQRIN
jgi:transcriptional regulator with XRE-family HTH domain